jgi:hypothetical protein
MLINNYNVIYTNAMRCLILKLLAGLRRGSAAARVPGLWVRIPPRALMSLSCECGVLSGRGLCEEPITRPEKSYRI